MQFRINSLFNRFFRQLQFYGVKKILKKIGILGIIRISPGFLYRRWIAENERESNPACDTRDRSSSFPFQPKISLLVPVWNTERVWLEKAITSVSIQSYRNWELCIVYAGPHDPSVTSLLSRMADNDKRIRVQNIDTNRGIAGNTNAALGMATGEFCGFLDQDDELSPDALYEVVDLLNRNPGRDLIYTDHDTIDTAGLRRNPYLKPDFSLPFLLSGNYFLHFVVCRTSLLQEAGGLRAGFEGAQDYDLMLRLTEKTGEDSIGHIRKVLYHWRTLDTSCAQDVSRKPLSSLAGKNALDEYLQRNDIRGEVFALPHNTYRVCFTPRDPSRTALFLWQHPDEGQIDTPALRTLMQRICSREIPCAKPESYAAYCPEKHPGYMYDEDVQDALRVLAKDESHDFVVVIQPPLKNSPAMSFHTRWLEELVSLHTVFPAGVVGCGGPVYYDVLCSVPYPCGPVFCVRRPLLEKFLESWGVISGFSAFQMDVSRFAEGAGRENISTPYCLQVMRDPILLYEYYHQVPDHRFFTRNMRYYLKPVFIDG
ncbi:MAG: glycosyltransferase [Methanoregula sp.]|jgi:glycosyltransferase involved in cell wall biosynthesis